MGKGRGKEGGEENQVSGNFIHPWKILNCTQKCSVKECRYKVFNFNIYLVPYMMTVKLVLIYFYKKMTRNNFVCL